MTPQKWNRAVVVFGLILILILCIFLLFNGAEEHSVSNLYIVPGGTFSPFSAQPPEYRGEAVPPGATAIAIAVQADKIATPYPEAKERFLRGLALSTQYARYHESLVYFDEALAIDPRFAGAWVAKGVALHNLQCYDEAVACYDRAIAIDTADATARLLKATTLQDRSRPGTVMGSSCKARISGDPGFNVTGRGKSPEPVCTGNGMVIRKGGDVFLGDSCLDVSAAVSSGQTVSWYRDGRQPGNGSPDETRTVADARHFFINPYEFLGFEGNWYAGSTDEVAFVVKLPVLDLKETQY